MYCSKCGAQIDDESVFCKVCGFKVNQIIEETFESKPSVIPNNGITIVKKKSKAPVIIAVLLVLIIAAATISYVIISNRTYIGDWVGGYNSIPNDTGISSFKIRENHEFIIMTDDFDGAHYGNWQESNDSEDIIIAICDQTVINVIYKRSNDTITLRVFDENTNRFFTGTFHRSPGLEW